MKLKANHIFSALIVAMLWAPAVTFGQSADDNDVNSALTALHKAMVDADSVTLTKLVAERVSYGHSSGWLQDKPSFIHDLTSGKSDFVSIEATDKTISLFDKTVIVRYKLTGATNDGGKPGNVKLGILMVWQKEKGKWLLIARQAVKLQ